MARLSQRVPNRAMAKSVPATRDHGSASNVESRERATAARTPTRRKVASRRDRAAASAAR
ncbi:MAG: hypothetical protein DMF95_06110 [Acidobacteria bacterium]|nr:MAG: hypothetical protein DMF95_06110 [Acidobacteriota bacterium]